MSNVCMHSLYAIRLTGGPSIVYVPGLGHVILTICKTLYDNNMYSRLNW